MPDFYIYTIPFGDRNLGNVVGGAIEEIGANIGKICRSHADFTRATHIGFQGDIWDVTNDMSSVYIEYSGALGAPTYGSDWQKINNVMHFNLDGTLFNANFWHEIPVSAKGSAIRQIRAVIDNTGTGVPATGYIRNLTVYVKNEP